MDTSSNPEQDIDSSDIGEETQNSDNHGGDDVEMDVTQSYYHTDTSLLNVDRVNPGTEVWFYEINM